MTGWVIGTFSQSFSSALPVWDLRCSEDLEEKSVSQLVNQGKTVLLYGSKFLMESHQDKVIK